MELKTFEDYDLKTKNMKFKTLEDYDTELVSIKKSLNEMEEYIKEHPERLGYAGNRKTLKYIYDIYIQNRIDFVRELNDINLHLKGDSITDGMAIGNLNSLGCEFNKTENLLSKSNTDDLIVKSISPSPYKIQFAFKKPSDDDVKRTSKRKKGLLKLFDFISCGDDVEKLKKEAEPEGIEALKQYKKFINEIVKNNADFTLDTEKGSLKAGLTLQQCKNICQNLNI